ncbi:carbohydrate-binding protein [Citrobacter youngae]|uniref:carbohydrate-binding protein n=1 Tax=Citrobacter youngae TaxID=133448 RepID=UPI000E13808D|nr:Uncharacterised protein [Citrobacter youngae]
MSKIARYQGNVRAFASDAQGLERTVFGGTNQADDLTSQITASFLRGWGIVGASEHPSLEDFNAAMYAMSQFIAYQHQMGVPEWHSEQEYHIGSMCTYNGESYQSLQNANVGSQPPSAKWTPVLTSKNGLSNLGLGEAAKMDVGTGADQIPDMSAWEFVGNSSAGYFKAPNGFKLQWLETPGMVQAASDGVGYWVYPFLNCIFAFAVPVAVTLGQTAGNVVAGKFSNTAVELHNWGQISAAARIIGFGR